MYRPTNANSINSHKGFSHDNYQRASAFRPRAPFKYQRQNYTNRPPQNYNIEHWCETCDRSFPTTDLLLKHKQQHQKCNIDGCQFIAHPKVITKHIQMQHATGIYKKIANLNNPEDIKKWREERKKKYPTKVNIEKKEAEIKEKLNRGEKLGLKYDGHRKYRIGNDLRKRKYPNNNQNQQQKRHRSHRQKKTQVINNNNKTNTIPIVDNQRKLQPFSGIQDIIIECAVDKIDETQCSFEINDIDVEEMEPVKPAESAVLNTIPTVCGALSSLICNYESSEDEIEETNDAKTMIEKPRINLVKLPLEDNTTSSTKQTNNDNDKSDDDSGPEEVKVHKQTETDVTKDEDNITLKNTTKTIRKENIPRCTNKKRYVQKHSSIPSTLLQKLLHKEIQQERNIVLQCIRHIVKNNFFDKSK